MEHLSWGCHVIVEQFSLRWHASYSDMLVSVDTRLHILFLQQKQRLQLSLLSTLTLYIMLWRSLMPFHKYLTINCSLFRHNVLFGHYFFFPLTYDKVTLTFRWHVHYKQNNVISIQKCESRALEALWLSLYILFLYVTGASILQTI